MSNQTRFCTDLGGLWQFSVPGGPVELRKVPGSYDCVGDSIWSRTVTMTKPAADRRTMLCFEGIAYEASVLFNGKVVGEMLPYSYYEFDISELIAEGENAIEVQLMDLTAVFGPSEGWKSYSGIVRAVYLSDVPASRLTDVFFTYELSENFRSVACKLPFTVSDAPAGACVRSQLLFNGVCVAESAAVSVADGTLALQLDAPLLWTPDKPNLYTLVTELSVNGALVDVRTEKVGFRSLVVRGSKFYLNGEDFFFAGVARHDLWTDEAGFTMTDEEIDRDLQMIHDMGANYVRLVHYPHDRRVVEAADRIGLFVSEEPGLWWNDLSDTNLTSRALTVLDKVIHRDRNHVSIAFWLSFNECPFNEEFLHKAVATARAADPTRLISGANCNDTRETKEMFDKCDVDFYTLHPYGTHPTHCNGNTFEDACRVLSGKPVIFTEWGGYYVVDNPHLFRDFADEMKRLHRNHEPDPVLAGMCYWQWQDICEFQRGEPACFDGVLTEGIVTADRKPKMCYFTFMEFLRELKQKDEAPKYALVLKGAGIPDKTYVPLALPQSSDAAWQEALNAGKPMPQYHWKKERRIKFGPKLPCAVTRIGALGVDCREGNPLVLSTGSDSITVPAAGKCSAVWFVGQATMGKGWPLAGSREEIIGSYTLNYADGTQKTVTLRNGVECANACGLMGPTAFNPVAAAAPKAFTLSYDKNWEIYHVNQLRIAADAEKELKSITAEVSAEGYFLLLYGISLEK